MDMQEILRNVITSTNEIFQAEAGSVALLEAEGREIVIRAAVGAGADAVRGLRIPVSKGVIGWVATQEKPALIPDVTADSRFFGDIDKDSGFHTKSIMCVPMQANGHIIGVIELMNMNAHYLSEDGLKILGVIADHAALAIENARLLTRTRQQAEEQAMVFGAMAILTSDLGLDTVLDAVSRQMVEALNADVCIIYRWNANQNQLQPIQYYNKAGLQRPAQLALPLKTNSSLIAALKNQKPVIVTAHDKTIALQQKKRMKRLKLERSLYIPLIYRRQPIGLVEIGHHHIQTQFTPDKLSLGETMAAQAAVAIEHARLFEEIKATEGNYRDLFDNANDLIFTLDSNFRISSANKETLKVTGYSLPELIGLPIISIISPTHNASLFSVMKQHLRHTHTPSSFELSLRNRAGQEKLIEVTMRIKRNGRRAAELHFIARDITRRRELERQLQQTEKLSSIGKLVAGVAHELNNPLTSIIGYTSLLEDSDLLPQQKKDLHIISRQAERARVIVRDLLTFARNIHLDREVVDVNEVIHASLMLLKPQLQQHNVHVINSLDFGLPRITADPHRLEQVFVNLIINSIQALARQPRKKVITIKSSHTDDSVLVTLADNGPGIREEFITRIFDPFFSTKQVGEGTGLGLSICFGIVSAHGGKIWAENVAEGGSQFIMELPLTPAESSYQRLQTPISPLPVAQDNAVRILVVDDETYLLELMNRVLSSSNHTVYTTENGRKALNQILNETFDIIICDILMPDLSGIELYHQAIAVRPQLADKFIFVTGNVVDPDTRAFLANNKLNWLAKPFLPADILNAISQTLNSAKAKAKQW